MAYLQAVINNVVKNLPVRDTNEILTADIARHKLQDEVYSALCPNIQLPYNTTIPPVTTLSSAKRHLGIDANQWITEYAACLQCWKRYPPKKVQAMESPDCEVDECEGTVWDLKVDKNGKESQVPRLIVPQVSLIQSIQRMVHRKGFGRRLRESRNSPRNQNDDPDFVMKDIHDGMLWHKLKTQIYREVGDQGTVHDVGNDGAEGTRLVDHRYGLHMSVNIDWYVFIYLWGSN
jgi:hypothetical protein